MMCLIKKISLVGVLMMGLLIGGCSSNSVDMYKNDTPKLSLEQYLNGHIKGQGVVQNWRGKVVTRFAFAGDAHWKDDVGTFDEKMTYYNGDVDTRVWTIKKVSEGHYIGTTPDVIGHADIRVSGNAMNWHYQMNVKVGKSTYKLSFDDWMFLMKDGVLVNLNTFKKFGFSVGHLSLFMQKVGKENAS